MDLFHLKTTNRGRGRVALVALVIWLVSGQSVSAQQAQINIDDPSGGPNGSLVGPALGAAAFSDGSPVAVTPLTGRPGFSGSHAPVAGVTNPVGSVMNPAQVSFKPNVLKPASLPTFGNIELPKDLGLALGEEAYGPGNGLTITSAIEMLLTQNLDLLAAKLEVPMSEADVVTASLRANPVFYADQQLLPYGHFSFLRPGGPQQADVNVSIPLDVSRKRAARTASAINALKVTQAQLKDNMRLQIDNLYTVYEDVVVARLTLKFSLTSRTGISKIYEDYLALSKRGEVRQDQVDAVEVQLHQADIQIREAMAGLIKAQQALALILSLPPETPSMSQVFDLFRDVKELPETTEQLVQRAMGSRPDLIAMHHGVDRSITDVTLAKRNAYPDIYLLAQPYTFVNNQYIGVNPSTSYAFGITANIPLFNRNQGNITRARRNVDQTKIQYTSLERRVLQDVLDAIREFEQSRLTLIDIEEKVIPVSRRIKDTSEKRFRGGEIPSYEFFQALQDFNSSVKDYRDALIRHRRAMLDLNTAVGVRLY
jgi:cobalt-zinc-cadmium efflux system outer membrane protein